MDSRVIDEFEREENHEVRFDHFISPYKKPMRK